MFNKDNLPKQDKLDLEKMSTISGLNLGGRHTSEQNQVSRDQQTTEPKGKDVNQSQSIKLNHQKAQSGKRRETKVNPNESPMQQDLSSQTFFYLKKEQQKKENTKKQQEKKSITIPLLLILIVLLSGLIAYMYFELERKKESNDETNPRQVEESTVPNEQDIDTGSNEEENSAVENEDTKTLLFNGVDSPENNIRLEVILPENISINTLDMEENNRTADNYFQISLNGESVLMDIKLARSQGDPISFTEINEVESDFFPGLYRVIYSTQDGEDLVDNISYATDIQKDIECSTESGSISAPCGKTIAMFDKEEDANLGLSIKCYLKDQVDLCDNVFKSLAFKEEA